MALNIGKLKEKFDKKSERTDRFLIQNGENYIRILPPSIQYLTEEVDYIDYSYLMHYRLGVEGDKQAVVCPKSAGKHHRCPVCEAVARLYKNDTVEDKSLANDIRAKKRHIFNVIDLNNPDKGIQILETGPKVFEDLVEFLTNPKWGDLIDLDTGKNITIAKTDGKDSSTGYTEYKVIPDPNSTSVRKILPENFKEQIGKLQKAVPESLSYDEIKQILEGNSNIGSATKVSAEEPQAKNEEAEEDVKPAVNQPSVVEAKKEIKEEPKPPVPPSENPSCFGKDYGPRRPECTACVKKVACREKFLEI